VTAAALVLLALLVVRLLRLPVQLARRALPLAFAAAVGTSLVVNDSPKEVALAGLACYLVVEAVALGPDDRWSRVLRRRRALLRDRPRGGLAT
jgi:hypothetical protein